MKKISLKDMKNKNRRLVLQLILEHDTLSRIEISQYSELSPSTVSSLVAELLEEGILVETGEGISTGGRRRTGLSVNQEFGSIAVVDIKRTGADLGIFDMQLNLQQRSCLHEGYITGNELLIAITTALCKLSDDGNNYNGKLGGIGLLFQEDMVESELNVIYSTGLSSSIISLKDALVTQFHIPVVEEHTQSYTVSDLAAQTAGANSAYINIGRRVLSSITLGGKPMDMRGSKVIDLTPLLADGTDDWPLLSAFTENQQPSFIKSLIDGRSSLNGKITALAQLMTNALKPLCVFFPIDTIFLGGTVSRLPGFAEATHTALTRRLSPLPAPTVQLAGEPQNDLTELLAHKIRKNILCSG